MKDFDYVRAKTLDDALALLGDPRVASYPLTGRIDFVPGLRHHDAPFDRVVDVTRVAALRGIQAGDVLTVGAMEPLAAIAASPAIQSKVPLLAEACRRTGGVQVRNVATLGGSLEADPGGALAAVMVCLDAAVVVAGPDGERRCPLDGLLHDPAYLPKGELARAFVFAPPPDPARTAFLRIDRRRAMAAPALSLAALASLTDGGSIAALRLVPGALFAGPRRLSTAEAVLLGQQPADHLIEQAADAARKEIDGAADVEPSVIPYIQPALMALVRRALQHILGDAS